jgi:oxygen-independent coproporphyrinogen-3 oxidase
LFEARTGLDLTVFEPRLLQLHRRELLECDDRGIRASALGRRFLDSVIAEFFPD